MMFVNFGFGSVGLFPLLLWTVGVGGSWKLWRWYFQKQSGRFSTPRILVSSITLCCSAPDSRDKFCCSCTRPDPTFLGENIEILYCIIAIETENFQIKVAMGKTKDFSPLHYYHNKIWDITLCEVIWAICSNAFFSSAFTKVHPIVSTFIVRRKVKVNVSVFTWYSRPASAGRTPAFSPPSARAPLRTAPTRCPPAPAPGFTMTIATAFCLIWLSPSTNYNGISQVTLWKSPHFDRYFIHHIQCCYAFCISPSYFFLRTICTFSQLHHHACWL